LAEGFSEVSLPNQLQIDGFVLGVQHHIASVKQTHFNVSVDQLSIAVLQVQDTAEMPRASAVRQTIRRLRPEPQRYKASSCSRGVPTVARRRSTWSPRRSTAHFAGKSTIGMIVNHVFAAMKYRAPFFVQVVAYADRRRARSEAMAGSR
jgi:hypothetical protein